MVNFHRETTIICNYTLMTPMNGKTPHSENPIWTLWPRNVNFISNKVAEKLQSYVRSTTLANIGITQAHCCIVVVPLKCWLIFLQRTRLIKVFSKCFIIFSDIVWISLLCYLFSSLFALFAKLGAQQSVNILRNNFKRTFLKTISLASLTT